MPRLTVQLVTWNGKKYVPYLFESLRKQTSRDWELFIWDNASSDGMSDAMKKEIEHFPVPVTFEESKENKGFAGGHNAVFLRTKSEYVLLLNQDMYLEETLIENMIHFLDRHPEYAAVSPRLMRWDFQKVLDAKIAESFTNFVDSLGLEIFRNRRVIDLHTQKDWPQLALALKTKEEGNVLPVFGLSGALPIFRRSTLAAVAFEDGRFFDESYGSYKEDVDLALRLRSAGHESAVLLSSVTHHDRSAAGPTVLTDDAARKNKKTQSSWVKYQSYKNHLMTLYKNEYGVNFWLDFPFILWYELKKFAYFLVLDRTVLKGLSDVWKHRKSLKLKRHWITKKRVATAKDIRAWWI